MDQNLSKIFAYIDKSIAKRIEKWEEEGGQRSEPKDLLDHFLNQMHSVGDEPAEGEQYFKWVCVVNLNSKCHNDIGSGSWPFILVGYSEF